MVIDSSAIIAILLNEPDSLQLAQAMAGAPKRLVSGFTVLEAGIVIEAKKGAPGGRELDLLLHRSQMEIVPFTAEQAEFARTAWRRYGKGRHPAGLNIGDCCSYALAKYTDEPLLFVGNDLSQTDLPAVDYIG